MATSKQTIEKYTLIAFLVLLTLDVSVHYLLRQEVPIAKSQTENVQKPKISDGEATEGKDGFKEKFEEYKNTNKKYNSQTNRNSEDEEESLSERKKRQRIEESEKNFDEGNDEDQFESRNRKNSQKKKKRRSLQLKILYCSSGNYKSNFDQIQQSLMSSDDFPGLEVYGLEYQNKPLNQLGMKALTYFQYGMILLNFFGDRIFGYLKMDYPRWYLLLKEKKMIAIFIVFFAGNYVRSALYSGAFEIYADEKLIYSKLQTHALPNVGELIHLVEKQYEK